MRDYIILLIFIAFYLFFVMHGVWHKPLNNAPDQKVLAAKEEIQVKTPPASFVLPQSHFVAQSFNNCGPASLSMVLSMFGKTVSQEELRDQMRPFNNPYGGVDDKSIFADEFVTYARKYGLSALSLPNGDISTLKQFVANGIPVVVRTWLHPNEDIGHFRIVRGYDSAKQSIIQDDSYQGPGLSYSYDEFLSMWQPFDYGYIIIYPPAKQDVVEEILGKNYDKKTAYKNSISRAQKELKNCHSEQREESLDSSATPQNDNNCIYAQFNIATAYYYLGNYKEAINWFEKVEPSLPSRMLWYQPEPIYAYEKVGNSDRVFSLTDSILNNGNLAYSELYEARGEMDLKNGNKEAAKSEFEKAVYYNKNYQPAKDQLRSL